MRIRQHFVPGGRVERSAFGIFDAGVKVQRRSFSPAGIFDSLSTRKGVNILVVEIKLGGERTKLRGLRNAAKGVFGSDLCQCKGRIEHAIEAFAREITGVRAGRTLAKEDSNTDCAGSGFL